MIIATSLLYLSAVFTLHSGATVSNTVFDNRGNTPVVINRSDQVNGNYYVIPDSFVNAAFTMAPSQFLTNADYPETLRFEATFVLDDEHGTWLSLTNFATISFNLTSSTYVGFEDYTVSGWVAENEINFQFNFHNYLRFGPNGNTNNHMAFGYSPYICCGPHSFTGYNDIFWNFGNEQGSAVRNKLIVQWGMLSSDFFSTESSYNSGYNSGYNDGYSKGYDEGETDGTSAGYEDGYLYGYNIGFSEGENTANTYTFGNLFKSIVDTPIWFLQSLFGFSLFGQGETLMGIITSLITALIVIALVKKVF